jgi:PAS domain S-box-containing protein
MVFRSGSVTSIGRIGRSRLEREHLRLGFVAIAVTLVAASGLVFDALTPRVVSVTMFYVGVVLVGFWLPQPKAPLALALLTTPLIIIGYWLSIPDPTPAWESWVNRGLSIGSVWLAAVFVWRFRILEKKLQQQIDIAAGLSDEGRLLASIVESSDDAIISKNLDGVITSWNTTAERLFGYVAEEVVGKSVKIIIPPERHHEEDMILGRIRCGERVEHYETVRQRKDGTLIDISLTVSPVRDAEGTVVGASKIARDITERKHVEEELRKSEERFRSSIVQSPVPTILFDDREQILAISRSWLKAAGGISAAELRQLEDWTVRAHGGRSGEVLELIRGIIATEPEARADEMTIFTRGGDKRIWSFVTSSLGTKSDGRRLFASVALDVTERKAYEERIHLLMREARHRAKNILSLVQAIARQTATGDAQDFIGRFTERIQALAANQDLLVRHEWQRIDVKDLVQAQLGHFADLIGARINLDGPKLHLNAVAAQAVGLALHELATNASKYGALSTGTGRIDVSWQLDDDTFKMSWIERNGPPVHPPERRGFGSTVTESMVKQALGGEVQLDYASSGLEWRLTCHAADALERPSSNERSITPLDR